MLFLSLFGPPGAGKGTQAQKISEKYNIIHLSTGDLIRQEIAKETELGRQAEEIIRKGQLLPDDTVMNMVYHIIGSHPEANGVLFDGFPRTVHQAEMLDNYLQTLGGHVLDALISIEVPKEELIRRIQGRAVLEGRSDDTLEGLENRFREYDSKTIPVADYYRKQNRYYSVDGLLTIDEVFRDITGIIERE